MPLAYGFSRVAADDSSVRRRLVVDVSKKACRQVVTALPLNGKLVFRFSKLERLMRSVFHQANRQLIFPVQHPSVTGLSREQD